MYYTFVNFAFFSDFPGPPHFRVLFDSGIPFFSLSFFFFFFWEVKNLTPVLRWHPKISPKNPQNQPFLPQRVLRALWTAADEAVGWVGVGWGRHDEPLVSRHVCRQVAQNGQHGGGGHPAGPRNQGGAGGQTLNPKP